MSKRRRPAFDNSRVYKVTGKGENKKEHVHGGPPKKLTKKLQQHLEKVKRQNPDEYLRQMQMIGK